MEVYSEFKKLTTEYDQKLFELFRTIIDTAVNYTIQEKMDAVDRYVYVNNTIEDAYKKLACAQGIIGNCDLPYAADPQISDELEERIYTYIDPIASEARKVLQDNVDRIMISEDLGELMDRLKNFKEYLNDKGIESSFYEDLNTKKRV